MCARYVTKYPRGQIKQESMPDKESERPILSRSAKILIYKNEKCVASKIGYKYQDNQVIPESRSMAGG